MRVLVELLDKEPVENVLSTCIFQPEIVVFLCDQRDSSLVKENAIYRLLRHRRLKTKPRFLYFDATDPGVINRVMYAVVRDYPGCVFDFSGGRDLVLLVAGTFCKENRIPGYYIDIPTGRFVPVIGCEELRADFTMPSFSAEDVLSLAGATIHGYGHFRPGQLDETLERDIEAVWPLVAKHPKAWGEFVSVLQTYAGGTPSATLQLGGPKRVKSGGSHLRCNPAILEHLAGCGIIHTVQQGPQEVSFHVKSPLHKQCLLNSGIWLELYTYLQAKNSGAFNDARTSVVIDWSGVDGGVDNTKNEIDVFLVQGITPIFISCKMSVPSPLALSEIMLLARRFGGQWARPVVVTAARLKNEHKAIRQRAADLGIELLDGDVLAGDTLVARLQNITGGEGARVYYTGES